MMVKQTVNLQVQYIHVQLHYTQYMYTSLHYQTGVCNYMYTYFFSLKF